MTDELSDQPLATPEEAMKGLEWALAIFIFVTGSFIAVALLSFAAAMGD